MQRCNNNDAISMMCDVYTTYALRVQQTQKPYARVSFSVFEKKERNAYLFIFFLILHPYYHQLAVRQHQILRTNHVL